MPLRQIPVLEKFFLFLPALLKPQGLEAGSSSNTLMAITVLFSIVAMPASIFTTTVNWLRQFV